MMRRLWLTALLAAALPASGLARYPGAVFLMIFPDARTTALGGCGVALDDMDANAYYNPAGIGFGPRAAATWTHVNWLSGLCPRMSYDHFGASYRLNERLNLAANITYMQTGLVDVVSEIGQYVGSYRPWDMAPSVSGAYSVTPRFSAGVALKAVYSLLSPEWAGRYWWMDPDHGDALTFACDAGLQYRPLELLGLGVSLSNFGPDIRYNEYSTDPLPLTLRGGFALKPRIPGPVEVALVGDIWRELISPIDWTLYDGDSTISWWENLEHGIGLEVKVASLAVVRLGYFEDILGQRGGLLVRDSNYYTHRISLLRYLVQHRGKVKDVGWCWGVGLEYRGVRLDVGVDESIYDFATRNVRFQLSARL